MVDTNNRTPLGATLKQGLDTLSLNQTIEFTLYRRVILPIDGYAYWVKTAEPTLKVMGALHYNSDLKQEGDVTQPSTRIVFSSQDQVRDFTVMDPQTLYMAWFEGNQFAFSSLGAHFQQSNLWHYLGSTNFAEYANLIVDDITQVPTELIISNSLPSWLAINTYTPLYPVLIQFPDIPLYPEFLSPMNLTPPYGTVNIVPDDTSAYGATPMLMGDMSSDQLAHDRVIVTMYGATNRQARDFLAAVNQYTLDTERFGIVGIPAIVRDDQKAVATETLLLAHKKRIIFEVSYLQQAQRDIARQLIEKVIVTVVGVDTFESSNQGRA
jgi:hypothetical protein